MRAALAAVTASLVACGGAVESDAPDATTSSSDAATDAPALDTAKPGDDAVVIADASPPVEVGSSCDPHAFSGVGLLDEITSHSLRVTWTPPKGCASLTYDVHIAAPADSFDFGKKPEAVVVGGSSVVMDGLAPATTYTVGVRARIGTGDVDSNVKMLTARTLAITFADVQPIFDRNCAISGCHVLPTPPQALNLAAGFAYANIVDVTSVESAPMKRVLLGDPEQSWLYLKVRDKGHGPTLTKADLETIRAWIAG